jgi:hypothetical protein
VTLDSGLNVHDVLVPMLSSLAGSSTPVNPAGSSGARFGGARAQSSAAQGP